MTQEFLTYRDSEGIKRELKGIRVTQDKHGKFWIWCPALEHNLAYKSATREDALLASIHSLLFTIELQQKRIDSLQRVYNLAMMLADEVKPDEED